MTDRFIDCIFKARRDPQEIANLIQDIERASRLSGDCDIVTDYEAALAEHFGVACAIAVSSGTAALHAALAEVIQPGDEVLLPVIGVPMTAAAILQAGGVPVFYDCAPGRFVPDLSSLEQYTTSRTRALITVPMWGYPGINSKIMTFARKHGLVVIEDTAQAVGTKQQGRFEGTIGDIGCFSTHEFKLMSTGEGGFILTDNQRLGNRMREFTRIGFSLDAMSFGHRSGLNYKLPALQASMGISQLGTLDARIAQRREKIAQWRKALGVGAAGAPFWDFADGQDDTGGAFAHNGYSYAIRIREAEPGMAREVSAKLFELGVNTDIHRYKQSYLVNFPMLRSFYADPRYTGDCRRDFPNATALIDSLLVLPLHDQIDADDIEVAAKRLRSIL